MVTLDVALDHRHELVVGFRLDSLAAFAVDDPGHGLPLSLFGREDCCVNKLAKPWREGIGGAR